MGSRAQRADGNPELFRIALRPDLWKEVGYISLAPTVTVGSIIKAQVGVAISREGKARSR